MIFYWLYNAKKRRIYGVFLKIEVTIQQEDQISFFVERNNQELEKTLYRLANIPI